EMAGPQAAPAPEKPGVVARALFEASVQAATSEAGGGAQTQGAAGQDLGGRGIMDSRQSLRGKVNAGGPEDWPEESGLSTTTADVPQGAAPAQAPATQAVPQASAPAPAAPAQPAPVPPAPASPPQAPAPAPQPATPQPAAGQNVSPAPAQIPASAPASAPAAAPTAQEAQPPAAAAPAAPAQQPETPAVRHEGRSASGAAVPGTVGLPLGEKAAPPPEPEKPREVIYVDEQGNPVPKPPEPDKMFAEAEALMDEGKYDEALPAFEAIRQLPNLSPELLEKVLYRISDCMWARYADNPLAGFDPIVSSTSEAMNANLRSPRVPDALLRLGLANA
ncbi:MAG: hypothetical protein K2N07_07055, partial [Desulfovibrio sp.]|nr:hypothetical protein [Desulfovibrio sp.]